jgi:ubiquinone biosynthesis protein UbiJ
LVFVGEDQVERLSIRLGDRRVEVLEGGQSLPDEAVLLVRSTLSEWLRFCAEPNLEHLGQLELFGDLDLLQTVAKLIQAKRSAISARFFASEARRPVARTNRRRTRNAHH